MKDDRWVNRFHYIWKNSPFFIPIDKYETKETDFLSGLSESVKKRAERFGIWYGVNNDLVIPPQGWKIHVSATYKNAEKILKLVSEYLIEKQIMFKFALDFGILGTLNSKAAPRGGSGKFITIYPENNIIFRDILIDLYEILKYEEGPYILSDKRYRDCKCLYFRYGQFHRTYQIDIMGRRQSVIFAADGSLYADKREAYFSSPEWLDWPFEDWNPDFEEDTEDNLLNSRYHIDDVIAFSNSGGVYVGIDRINQSKVIIKEYRPHTNFNHSLKYDSFDLAQREWDFLNLLSDTGITPRPIEFFQEWEHKFIVEEFVDGVDIREFLLKNNPLLKRHPSRKDSEKYLRLLVSIFTGYARSIKLIHNKEIAIGDMNAKNFLIDSKTFEVKIIDLETARLTRRGLYDKIVNEDILCGPIDMFTPGFHKISLSRDSYTSEDDMFGLGSTLAYFIFPISVMSFLRKDTFEIYKSLVADMGWSNKIYDLLIGIIDGNLNIDDVLKILQSERLISINTPLSNRTRNIVKNTYNKKFNINKIEDGLLSFIIDNIDISEGITIPSDPFAYSTNRVGFGFGISGALYSISRANGDIPLAIIEKYLDNLKSINNSDYSSGFLTGLSGVAWALAELGQLEEAGNFINKANNHKNLKEDYSLLYGASGVGMTNLKLFLSTHSSIYLENAIEIAECMLKSAKESDSSIYWVNKLVEDEPFHGLGFGQSGVGLFMHRLYQISGDSKYSEAAQKSIEFDLRMAKQTRSNRKSFLYKGTGMPYIEVGTAGIIKAVLRVCGFEKAKLYAESIFGLHYILPGYLSGASGILDTMIDLYIASSDKKYLNRAYMQAEVINDLYIFNPENASNGSGFGSSTDHLATPGDGLLRISCDFATGSSGMLYVFNRLRKCAPDDLMLDQIEYVS